MQAIVANMYEYHIRVIDKVIAVLGMNFQLDFATSRSDQNKTRTDSSKLEQLNGRNREKFNARSMELLELRFKGRKKFI